MSDLIELTEIIVGFLAIAFVCVFIASLPFALIGWAIMMVAGLFGHAMVITYWLSAGYGLAVVVVVGLINGLK